jgi:hypothetical protein
VSKPDQNKIEFHAVVAIDRDEIKMSKGDVIAWRQDAKASDLGRLIAKTKGWRTAPEGPMHNSYLDLYVFTWGEHRDYMDAAFKAKLQHMAATEKYLSDEQREALMIQSERF